MSLASNIYAPRLDHTYSSLLGKYLLFTHQDPTATKIYTITTTKLMPFKGVDHCLTVWYYEDGELPFSVEFKLIQDGNQKNSQTLMLFSSAIENRQQWNLIKVDVGASLSNNASCKYFESF